MTAEKRISTQPQIILPDIPAMSVNSNEAVLLTTEGEIRRQSLSQAQTAIHKSPVLVCHAPYTRQRLGNSEWLAFDILELFAFAHPAKFCVPTPVGLARTLGVSLPESFEDYPFTLIEAAQALLSDLQKETRDKNKPDLLEIARVMGLQGKGWPWTPFIFSALGKEYKPEEPVITKTALNVWRHLPEWTEEPPPVPADHLPVSKKESTAQLDKILGSAAAARPQQIEYAEEITAIFAPLSPDGEGGLEAQPHLVLAEAATGTGKTLGYLAPASVWAEKNKGAVWISTYTRNLQRQIDQELDRLYPDPELKNAKVAIRKGRENYLCLLNMEDAVTGAALARHPDQAIAVGLMARWVEVSRDGDLSGGDFPGWLPGLLGYQHTVGLSDRRGECIYAACDHYHKCFVERSVRRANHAALVVANHALVMIRTATAGPNDMLPQRYIFDEGHHLFDAADSAFAAQLTARETHDLRRWLLGAEGGRRSRVRGLKRRLEDLITGHEDAEKLLDDILQAAHDLPAVGWSRRMKDNAAFGATEKFLALVRSQVMTRNPVNNTPYSLETQTRPLVDGLEEKAKELQKKLRMLQKPMRALSVWLQKHLNDNADTLDSDTRKRLESVSTSLHRRSDMTLTAWINMLKTLAQETSPQEFVDWMEITRIDGQAIDVGLYRHWTDPMKPFASTLHPYVHGMLATSATLCDRTDGQEEGWRIARERTGTHFLGHDIKEVSIPPVFDYAESTRIFVITDVNKNNLEQVAAAYRVLFEAAGGGGLGLFTAIQRLRAVRERIAVPLEEAGITLYAQHVDRMDTGTLVDIFRDDTHACLLGTDAVRDGIDVPGESLRLLVYDRVPWPRPSILHKARREAFGGRQRYDEMITRLKLRQAYGRLIRNENDKGVFVMLDSGHPTRLLDAYPENVEINRIGLAETVSEIKNFLGSGL